MIRCFIRTKTGSTCLIWLDCEGKDKVRRPVVGTLTMASDVGDDIPHHAYTVAGWTTPARLQRCFYNVFVLFSVVCEVNYHVKSEPLLSMFHVFPNVGSFVLPVKVGVSLTPLTAPLDCRYPPLSSISRCLASDPCRADTETDISSLVSVFLIM